MAAWTSRNKPDLGNLIISTFDPLYTSPLLTFRAFRRSAVISTVIWVLRLFIPYIIQFIKILNIDGAALRGLAPIISALLILSLLATILTDYVSLLFVRHFLRLAQTHPIIASVLSSTAGLIVVTSFFVLLAITADTLTHLNIYGNDPSNTTEPLELFVIWMRPALIIHFWLPLLALSLLIARLVYLILRAVEKAQWFLKQGDAHPLKAIGIVATIIVFGSAMLVKEGWALLSVLERS